MTRAAEPSLSDITLTQAIPIPSDESKFRPIAGVARAALYWGAIVVIWGVVACTLAHP